MSVRGVTFWFSAGIFGSLLWFISSVLFLSCFIQLFPSNFFLVFSKFSFQFFILAFFRFSLSETLELSVSTLLFIFSLHLFFATLLFICSPELFSPTLLFNSSLRLFVSSHLISFHLFTSANPFSCSLQLFISSKYLFDSSHHNNTFTATFIRFIPREKSVHCKTETRSKKMISTLLHNA